MKLAAFSSESIVTVIITSKQEKEYLFTATFVCIVLGEED